MEFPLNQLQNKLGYKFENIQLLHEALTHDFDDTSPEWDIFGDGNVFYKKRKFHRLKCVGVSVLKLLSVEKSIIFQHKLFDEGIATRIAQLLIEKIGFLLVKQESNLPKYVHKRNYVDSWNPTILKEVTQAIFGAIFIDAGGCDSENSSAIRSVRKLFDLLFGKHSILDKLIVNSENLQYCFPANPIDVRNWLLSRKYAVIIEPYEKLEPKISYEFDDPELLKTALTHDSVKGFLDEISHYEVLEFLGDAVYELVMCEYLFWYYINDGQGKFFNFETLRKFVLRNFQTVIANGLKMETFIIKPDFVKVTDTHDFLESVIGAIYVDAKSLSPVRKVLVEICRKFELDALKSCNIRLPHAWRTYYGSWHYRQKEKFEDNITEGHELPPQRQDVFRIINFNKLKLRLGNYYEFKKGTKSIQSNESRAKVKGSKSWCNQQEFGRVSLYQTVNRIKFLGDLYDPYTGKMFTQEHTYNLLNIEYKPECAPSSNYLVSESKQPHKVNDIEPNFNDVCNAAHTIKIWSFNLLKVFVNSFVKKSLRVLTITLKVFIKLMLATVLFILWCVFFSNLMDEFERRERLSGRLR